jgi:uncharacterized membrane protein
MPKGRLECPFVLLSFSAILGFAKEMRHFAFCNMCISALPARRSASGKFDAEAAAALWNLDNRCRQQHVH